MQYRREKGTVETSKKKKKKKKKKKNMNTHDVYAIVE